MDLVTLQLAKGYTDETVLGGGAIKGKNAVVKSIVEVEGGNEVTFQWTLDDGSVQTQVMFVKNGTDGAGNVASAEITTIKALDRAEYDALTPKDPKTLYLIKG